MKPWLCFFIVAACAGICFLYRQGIAASKQIQATLYIFQPGKGADRATLDSCTGWTRHVGRFHRSGTYKFILDSQLSKGDVDVVLLDREKQQILRLDRQSPAGSVEIDGENKYYLQWEFKNATGKCELHW